MKEIKENIKKMGTKNEQIGLILSFFKWITLGSIVGILCGTASAIFLHLLNFVTETREKNFWLIWFLPFAGILTTFLYLTIGKNSSRGNNLILEEIQNKKEKIPLRMGGLVLISTIISHLFGSSVGREGTAVQMGGSLSEAVVRIFKLNEVDRRIILMSGISGGFGSVFGTPIAGTIFGMEVSSFGAIKYEALIPCFVASFVGDVVAKSLAVQHTHYIVSEIPMLSIVVLIKVVISGVLFGFVASLFSEAVHFFKKIFLKIKKPILRPFIGGVLIIILTYIVGTHIYNGIGTKTIEEAFIKQTPHEAFLYKILFTSISLGSGFQGGEVTPLFYTGAVFGNLLSILMNMPVSFFAALGLIAVFSGASNAPIACFVLGIEMFGSEGAVYYFLVSIIAYIFSGHHGIYTSQMIATAKSKLLHSHEGKKISEIK